MLALFSTPFQTLLIMKPLAIFGLLLGTLSLFAQDSYQPLSPTPVKSIFKMLQHDAIAKVTIETDLAALINDRKRETYQPATFTYTLANGCLLYTSPSPRDATLSRMPSSA